MDASQLPKGQSAEVSFTGRRRNEPGIYEHPEAKVRLITQPGQEGNIQADALVRVGYQRVGDVPSREELLLMQKKQAAKDMAEEKAAKIREEKELKALEDAILAEVEAETAVKADEAVAEPEAPAEPVAEAAPAVEAPAAEAPAVSTK